MTLLRLLTLSVFIALATARSRGDNPNLDVQLPQQYAATAYGQAGVAAGKSFGVDIYAKAWTSEADIGEYAATLKKGGQDALVSALEKTKEVGRLSPTGFVGSAFRLARIEQTPDGGARIVMVTNRPMTFYEVYNGTRSRQYPFGILVLNIGKDGKGTGTLAPACKVKFDKNGQLAIEHYGQKPFRLANVRRMK